MHTGPSDTIRYVNLVVRLRSDDGPTAEQLWATAIDATCAGGTYRLANNGLHVPLVIDDVVEAWRDGDDRLQVTAVRARGGRPGWLVHLEEGEPQEFLVDEWRATGTCVEWNGWTVAVALDPTRGAGARPNELELHALTRVDRVLAHARLSDGVELAPSEAEWMDLELRAEPSEHVEQVPVRSLAS